MNYKADMKTVFVGGLLLKLLCCFDYLALQKHGISCLPVFCMHVENFI